jgi:hypothetical protein
MLYGSCGILLRSLPVLLRRQASSPVTPHSQSQCRVHLQACLTTAGQPNQLLIHGEACERPRCRYCPTIRRQLRQQRSWRSSQIRDGSMKLGTGCLVFSISCRAHRRLLPSPTCASTMLDWCMPSSASLRILDHPRHTSVTQRDRQCTSALRAVCFTPGTFHRTCGVPDLLDLNRDSKSSKAYYDWYSSEPD